MSEGVSAAAPLFADGLSSSREGFCWASGYARVLGEATPGGDGPMVAEVERLPGERRDSFITEDVVTALAALVAATNNHDMDGALRVWLQMEDAPEAQAAVVFTLARLVVATLIAQRDAS